MAERLSTDNRSITSTAELAVGDAIYSEASHTSYWVVSKTRSEIEIERRDGRKDRWQRDTFEESLEAHTWIRQSRPPSKVE